MVPRRPVCSRRRRLARVDSVNTGSGSVIWKMVQGLGAFKDPGARTGAHRARKKSTRRSGRCSGYSATVLHHLRSTMLSDGERRPGETSSCLAEKERVPADPKRPRAHRDLTRCAPADPYLPRGSDRPGVPRPRPRRPRRPRPRRKRSGRVVKLSLIHI